jgi:hypothetical protein
VLRPRIDDHLPPRRVRARDDLMRERPRQKPLGVIRQHDDVGRCEVRLEHREDGRLARRVGRPDVLVIQPHDLLMLADHPRLAQRRGAVVNRLQVHTVVTRAPGQRRAGLVPANQRDESRLPAERGDVGRGIRRAAEDPSHAVDPDHRHRRLGRDPAAVAGEVLVEDGVAKDEDAPAGKPANQQGETV